ncbi:hypothetical protein ACQP3J_28820, partial [Escherichia coli]
QQQQQQQQNRNANFGRIICLIMCTRERLGITGLWNTQGRSADQVMEQGFYHLHAHLRLALDLGMLISEALFLLD